MTASNVLAPAAAGDGGDALLAPSAALGDSTIAGLTPQQRLAAGSNATKVFIKAGPGTGKTTVCAHRYGVHRFTATPDDQRAVVAVSFTRSATRTLRRRVQRLWGPSALSWPHRIVTLDTIMCELLHDLLGVGLLQWPNGHVTLEVHDSWASFSGATWNRTAYSIGVHSGRVTVIPGFVASRRSSVPATEAVPRIRQGICTHQDVRNVLEQALLHPACLARVRHRLLTTMRALVVDEVFDANDLDIAIVELALSAGIAVTLVGDPWQALYAFRGARPELVPELLVRTGVRTLPLTTSFRWRSEEQRDLAATLRAGQPATLPVDSTGGTDSRIDVVLALTWKQTWAVGHHVLPLAFHAFKGGNEEAAATLLLNHITRNTLSEDATYLGDALTALAILDVDVPRQLEPELQQVVEILRDDRTAALNAAYARLVLVISGVSPRPMRKAHHAHTSRLADTAARLRYGGQLVPGLTTHQAKGREWDRVGLRLSDGEQAALNGGLSESSDTHRKLYVGHPRPLPHGRGLRGGGQARMPCAWERMSFVGNGRSLGRGRTSASAAERARVPVIFVAGWPRQPGRGALVITATKRLLARLDRR